MHHKNIVINYKNPGPFVEGQVVRLSPRFWGIASGPTEDGVTPVVVKGLVRTVSKSSASNMLLGDSVIESAGLVISGSSASKFAYTTEAAGTGTTEVNLVLR